MIFLTIAYPIVAVYVIIGNDRHSSSTVTLAVGVHLALVLVLQVLGTIRSTRSYMENNSKEEEER